jgi:hypothetical protein
MKCPVRLSSTFTYGFRFTVRADNFIIELDLTVSFAELSNQLTYGKLDLKEVGMTSYIQAKKFEIAERTITASLPLFRRP